MVGALLLRGMLAGVLAGVLSFGFLKIVGEPPVERAIAFESQHDAAPTPHAEAHSHGGPAPAATQAQLEPEPVSRATQAGLGLFTGVVVYSAAFGGLFALAFALAWGRMGEFSPRATVALLAAAGFVAVYLVPTLKYPANPPSVGLGETIGMRTGLYFSLIALSLAATIVAGMLRLRLERRLGAWNAALTAAAAYIVVMAVVALALPAINEVPDGFPASVLWQFRMAALGGQAILWVTLGLVFGAVAEHLHAKEFGRRTRTATL